MHSRLCLKNKISIKKKYLKIPFNIFILTFNENAYFHRLYGSALLIFLIQMHLAPYYQTINYAPLTQFLIFRKKLKSS